MEEEMQVHKAVPVVVVALPMSGLEALLWEIESLLQAEAVEPGAVVSKQVPAAA
jgi:hypothetical protein